MKRRFIILDRDGTINIERNYLSQPEMVELIDSAAEGLKKLKDLDFGLLVLTNQSAIGRGLIDWETLEKIHQRLISLLGEEGVALDGIYVCPHLPQDDCNCRKPRTGLVDKAVEDLDFDPSSCVVIGDKSCDIELGKAIGAKTILVLSGYGAQYKLDTSLKPDYYAENLIEAAKIIEKLKV